MSKKNQSKLIELNTVTPTPHGFWSVEGGGTFGYSDGDAAEDTLKSIVQKADDRSSLSLELEKSCYDWISEYHLSSERANIYRFLNLSQIKSGLELGSGCGAITRYLGESGLELDAVEGSRKRAEICRLRCEELSNVQVFQSNFNDLTLPHQHYDAVFLTGVIEYAKKFLESSKDDREAVQRILEKSLGSLKSDGIVCIAIENRMGLKYWLGASEDHFGFPYVGLYGYPQDEGIKTYDRNEWLNIIEGLGKDYHARFIYPFPDYKMAKAILSDIFLEKNPNASDHLYRIPSTDNGIQLFPQLNEALLWKTLQQQNVFEQYANSFFIIISKSEERLSSVCSYDFMHFSGKGRRAEYRTITGKQADKDTVEKKPVYSAFSPEVNVLEHDLSPDGYVSGSLLVSRWLNALAARDLTDFEQAVREFYEYVCSYFQENSNTKNCFDLLPFNIIRDSAGNWSAIDKEWIVNIPLSPEYLLFRALLWFPAGNEALMSPLLAEYNISTTKEFISHYFRLLSLSLEENLDEFVAWEEMIQSHIGEQLRENPVQNMLVQPLRQSSSGESSHSFVTQLYWSGPDGDWSEDKSVFKPGKIGAELQTITFKIPPSDKPITKIRFDPADRAGFFRIAAIRISPVETTKNDDGKNWLLTGNEAIAKATQLNSIEYCKNGLGDIFISTGNDPHFFFDLPEHVCDWLGLAGIHFSISLDWPKSSDYLVVMDTLGKRVVEQQAELHRLNLVEEQSKALASRLSEQAAKLKEKSDQVRSKEIYITTIEKEIETMRQTKVWRLAEVLRAKVYYRLLDVKSLSGKAIKTLRREGAAEFLRKLKREFSSQPGAARLGMNRTDYTMWLEHNRLTEYDIEEINRNISEFHIKPLFSIVVPVYDVDQEWLERAIDSVRNQLYENWELCLCDDLSPRPHVKKVLRQYADLDSRIKVLIKEQNDGIAVTSNGALSMATGDYVGLLDHDDELTPEALYENARVINQHPGAGLIYSDEDKLDMQGRRCDPFFKPDYSPELIRSQNYICHFTVIKKSILDELGGFRQGFDGSQDHDLILRAVEKANSVCHIPKILYHWRKIPGSTAAVYGSKSYAWEAGRKAIGDSLDRLGFEGKVDLARFQGSYRVRYAIQDNPLVSIIIPFRDKANLLNTSILSVLEKTSYTNFEIIGINNGSSESETQKVMDTLGRKDSRIRFVDYDIPFNFSNINNHGVSLAEGEYVVLLNNDIEVISPEWLEAMLEFAQMPDIGAVGGRLYYPDNRIQHAGIVIGMAGVAGPPHYLFHKDDVGYYARSHIIHNVSAVTGACLMVEKRLYETVGGLDVENFGIAYNDIDFCLKLLQKGYRNVYTPYCELYHYESQSRGYDDTPEKQERLNRESSAFRRKWKRYFEEGDPYYSPHLSLETTNFTIKVR